MSNLIEYNQQLDKVIVILNKFIKNPASANNYNDAMERQKALDIFDNVPDEELLMYFDKMKESESTDEKELLSEIGKNDKLFISTLTKMLEVISCFGEMEKAEDSDKQKYWLNLLKENFKI
jgi:hypothetical protein